MWRWLMWSRGLRVILVVVGARFDWTVLKISSNLDDSTIPFLYDSLAP